MKNVMNFLFTGLILCIFKGWCLIGLGSRRQKYKLKENFELFLKIFKEILKHEELFCWYSANPSFTNSAHIYLLDLNPLFATIRPSTHIKKIKTTFSSIQLEKYFECHRKNIFFWHAEDWMTASSDWRESFTVKKVQWQ